MTDLVFYTNPQSRGAIVHWMLEELGEPYDTVWLTYNADMKSPEYLAVNPMGKVPAVTHKGKAITEGAAICTYLAAAFPEKKLIPPTADASLADFYRWMFFAAGPFEQAFTARFMQWEVPAERGVSLGFGSIEQAFATLQLAVAGGPYICGEQFTAADVYVGSQLGYAVEFGILEADASLSEYISRLQMRPARQRAEQICQDRREQTEQSEE